MHLLTETENKILSELKNLRSTLQSTIQKTQAPDMRRNLKAVKVTVEGRLRSLAQQDGELAIYLKPRNHIDEADLLEESKLVLESIDRFINLKENS